VVYIQYNQQFAQRYNIRDEINPIILNDMDECNEWLMGQVDDNNDNEERGNERGNRLRSFSCWRTNNLYKETSNW